MRAPGRLRARRRRRAGAARPSGVVKVEPLPGEVRRRPEPLRADVLERHREQRVAAHSGQDDVDSPNWPRPFCTARRIPGSCLPRSSLGFTSRRVCVLRPSRIARAMSLLMINRGLLVEASGPAHGRPIVGGLQRLDPRRRGDAARHDRADVPAPPARRNSGEPAAAATAYQFASHPTARHARPGSLRPVWRDLVNGMSAHVTGPFARGRSAVAAVGGPWAVRSRARPAGGSRWTAAERAYAAARRTITGSEADARGSQSPAAASRGGRIRTGEPLRPKRSALTRLSYTPSTNKCTDGVTVCTDKLALRDLRKDSSLVVRANKVAEIRVFLRPRQMIPLHRGRMEGDAAVGAGPSGLERDIPGEELCVAS